LTFSCAIALLQKGAKVDDSVISIKHETVDLRKYYQVKGGPKLQVWEWFPTRLTEQEAGPKESSFSVYEVCSPELVNSVVLVCSK